MDTKKITQEPYDKADLDEAVETLRRGGIILYPTDTVWGIGCDATNEEAVRRIYELKRREDRQEYARPRRGDLRSRASGERSPRGRL